ncbi:right-handed parallel beta-helix repeat-containing protein [Pedobacter jamesrossensis]|uniref:Right-handed parallel beta-helix repeat-containing protein n=1 Tax=Pedobacter jamesrossensis TaxID=1908238 RepID=A0ABV8NRB4_9SPHI
MKKFNVANLTYLMAIVFLLGCKQDAIEQIKPEFKKLSVNAQLNENQPIYYVALSTQGGNNSSTNPTNINTPWATIQHALNNAPAGSIIEIKGGRYFEKVTLNRRLNGTAEAPTIVRNRQGETVTLDGSNIGADYGAIFKIGGDATEAMKCRYIQIDGIKVENAYWFGFSGEYCENLKIENCSSYKSRYSGIYVVRSSAIEIISNNVRRACTYPFRVGNNVGTQECITIAGVNNFKISKNEVWDTVIEGEGGEGIDAKGACYNGEIYENYIHDLYRNAIYVDAGSGTSYNIRVYRNKIYNCQSAGLTVGAELGGFAREIYFFNNVVKDCQRSGFEFINIQGQSARYGNIYIVNNTFYNNAKVGFTGEVANFSPNTADFNITIKNNIFYNKSSNSSRYSIFHNQASKHNISNNLFFDFKVSNNGANSYTQTMVSNSASLQIDPQFINAANADFHLKSTSPVINKGVLIYTPISPFPLMFTSDFDYRNKGGIWDIGAFEF